jgi:acid phosphatase (class A)
MNRRLPIIVALASLTVVAVSFGADELPHYLRRGQPDFVALLPPPPVPGSAEQAADLASTVAVHKACTPEELAAARSEEGLNIFVFAPAIGPFFQPGKLPLTEAFFSRVARVTDRIQTEAKNYWKRDRPYLVDPTLLDGKRENSYSYPSSHSTHAMVYALLLAELFPDKHAGILTIGRNVGWHRVQLGLHYPTDVFAGRVLAQAIVHEMKNSAAFRRDFGVAGAELATAAHPAP